MDIILTGMARAGTTLSCSLLNRLPQCVALHEPMVPRELAGLPYPEAVLEAFDAFFARQRAGLIERGVADSKAEGGGVPDNPYGTDRDGAGRRLSKVATTEVRFAKSLAPGFRLVVKHPAMFTATLADLRTRYPCFAIVRNPLSALLSWCSIKAPIAEGRVPAGETFDPGLKAVLDAEPDRHERQVAILRWSFTRYATHLPPTHVIRYEELVASRGRALAVIDPGAASLDEPLENRNANSLYDAALVGRLAEWLLSDPSVYAGFYHPAEIADVRDRLLASR